MSDFSTPKSIWKKKICNEIWSCISCFFFPFSSLCFVSLIVRFQSRRFAFENDFIFFILFSIAVFLWFWVLIDSVTPRYQRAVLDLIVDFVYRFRSSESGFNPALSTNSTGICCSKNKQKKRKPKKPIIPSFILSPRNNEIAALRTTIKEEVLSDDNADFEAKKLKFHEKSSKRKKNSSSTSRSLKMLCKMEQSTSVNYRPSSRENRLKRRDSRDRSYSKRRKVRESSSESNRSSHRSRSISRDRSPSRSESYRSESRDSRSRSRTRSHSRSTDSYGSSSSGSSSYSSDSDRRSYSRDRCRSSRESDDSRANRRERRKCSPGCRCTKYCRRSDSNERKAKRSPTPTRPRASNNNSMSKSTNQITSSVFDATKRRNESLIATPKKIAVKPKPAVKLHSIIASDSDAEDEKFERNYEDMLTFETTEDERREQRLLKALSDIAAKAKQKIQSIINETEVGAMTSDKLARNQHENSTGKSTANIRELKDAETPRCSSDSFAEDQRSRKRSNDNSSDNSPKLKHLSRRSRQADDEERQNKGKKPP